MNRFVKKFSLLGLVLAALTALIVCEPYLRNEVTFAVNYLNNPKIDYEKVPESQSIHPVAEQPVHRQKSHAPEPSTLLLFISGLCTMVARFIRKNFERAKTIFDSAFGLCGLLISLPIIAYAAILIKLTSKGPVIYKQERIGKDGKIFTIYKLRTMRADAEKGTGAVWAKANDPRITSVGRVLRKTRIDELPQLFNILKGDMSLIGPRPERPEIVQTLKTVINDYEKRLSIKPGITGLAQIFHKYDETIEDVKQKIKYDMLYIRKMCALTDLRIFAQTFVVVATGKGAR